MPDYLLGIDYGTSGAKCTIINTEGKARKVVFVN